MLPAGTAENVKSPSASLFNNYSRKSINTLHKTVMLVLKPSFRGVTWVKNIRVSEFTASRFGIPVHL